MPQVRKERLCARDAEHDPAQHRPAFGAVVDEPNHDPVRAEALEHGGPVEVQVVHPNAEDAPEECEEESTCMRGGVHVCERRGPRASCHVWRGAAHVMCGRCSSCHVQEGRSSCHAWEGCSSCHAWEV